MRRLPTTAFLALAIGLSPWVLTARAEDAAAEQSVEETADALMERLQTEVRAAQKQYYEDYKAAVAKAQEEAAASGRSAAMQAYDMGAAIKPFATKFADAAKRYAGTDDAVPFLVWVAFNARGEPASEGAIETLLSTHLRSPKIGRFAASLGYLKDTIGAARVRSALDAIIAQNPDGDAQAQALIARGELSSATDKDAARADFESAAAKAKDTRIAGRAKGILTEMDSLQIGMVAPEIDGKDFDGVAFKLSDYRGKVVVLDFWGDW